MYVPSIGEDFTVFVRQLVRAGFEHLGDYVRSFNEGDLVLRLRQDNRGRHKLSPPWEGPYVIAEVLKPGTYKLANENGEVLINA